MTRTTENIVIKINIKHDRGEKTDCHSWRGNSKNHFQVINKDCKQVDVSRKEEMKMSGAALERRRLGSAQNKAQHNRERSPLASGARAS